MQPWTPKRICQANQLAQVASLPRTFPITGLRYYISEHKTGVTNEFHNWETISLGRPMVV